MDAVIFHGALPFMTEAPRLVRGGNGALDSLRVEFLCGAAWEDQMRELGYQVDRKIPGYESLWVRTLENEPETESVQRVVANCEGLAYGNARRKRRLSCAGREWNIGPHEKVVLAWSEVEQGEDDEGEKLDKVKRRVAKLKSNGEVDYEDIGTPSGLADRWNIKEAIVTVTDTYFATTKPPMNAVGAVGVPPNAPTPPPYIWTGYDQPMRGRHPNGWVLDDRTADEIFYLSDEQGLWEVTDTYAYYYTLSPD